MAARFMRNGFTLAELLVVTGIVTILLSFLLPAVQAAREGARRLQCVNNLRQISLAALNHESVHSHLPGGGWGFAWVGMASRGSGLQQPGGWIYQVAEFADIRLSDTSDVDRADSLSRRLPIFACPSRPLENPSPYHGQVQLRNSVMPTVSFKSDYAGCGGDIPLASRPGPVSLERIAVRNYNWAHRSIATGVFFQGSWIRTSAISDGLSNTYLAGEKYAMHTNDNRDVGNDQAAFIGDDHDIRRLTFQRPVRDGRQAFSEAFGSSHTDSWNAAYVDGSVHSVSFSIDLVTHRRMGNKSDGQLIGL